MLYILGFNLVLLSVQCEQTLLIAKAAGLHDTDVPECKQTGYKQITSGVIRFKMIVFTILSLKKIILDSVAIFSCFLFTPLTLKTNFTFI